MNSNPPYYANVRSDALAFLPERVGRVLDFGGGTGATGAALRGSGRATAAILFDRVAGEAVPQVDVAEALDFEDLEAVAGLCRAHGPFDTILALDVLEHLRDPWATLAVLGSALLPGGRVLVSVPNVLSSDVLLPLLFADRFDYADGGVLDRTHLRWFTRKTAIELALSPGFVLEEVRTNPLPLRFRLAKLLSLGLLTRFVAWQWLVMVRKPD